MELEIIMLSEIKPNSKRQISPVFFHVWNLDFKKNDMNIKGDCLEATIKKRQGRGRM
jgi:hypothetical protein